MIARKRIYEKEIPCRNAQKVYIFCEGKKREIDYFNFFVEISSNLQVFTIPPEENQSDPLKLMNQATRLFLQEESRWKLDEKEHDLVWFAIDTDQWEEEGKIERLRLFCTTNNEPLRYRAWQIAQSNPCFEIWLYYHVYKEKPKEQEVSLHPSFKDFVNSKILGGFDSGILPIYIKDAIRHSAQNYSEEKGTPAKFSTNVFRLGDVIMEYAGKEIERKTRQLR